MASLSDLLAQAIDKYPVLAGRNIGFVDSTREGHPNYMLEAWPPGETGSPDYARPKALPLDQYGIRND